MKMIEHWNKVYEHQLEYCGDPARAVEVANKAVQDKPLWVWDEYHATRDRNEDNHK